MTGFLENLGLDAGESYIPCVNNVRSWSGDSLDPGEYAFDLAPVTNCGGNIDIGISFDISTCQ